MNRPGVLSCTLHRTWLPPGPDEPGHCWLVFRSEEILLVQFVCHLFELADQRSLAFKVICVHTLSETSTSVVVLVTDISFLCAH